MTSQQALVSRPSSRAPLWQIFSELVIVPRGHTHSLYGQQRLSVLSLSLAMCACSCAPDDWLHLASICVLLLPKPSPGCWRHGRDRVVLLWRRVLVGVGYCTCSSSSQ